jgi:mono/diheme cytochrome c family protein
VPAALGLVAGALAAQDVPTPAQSISAGSRVYGARGCGACHAVNGIGGTEGPDLAHLSARSLAGVVAALWNHLPQMAERFAAGGAPAPKLEAWEAADLVAFLFWAGSRAPAGAADVGRELFTSRQCVLCHRVAEVGGVLGPALDGVWVSGIDLAAALWNHAPAMGAEMRARRVPQPLLTRQDVEDLVAFFASGEPLPPAEAVHALGGRGERGAVLFRDRGCIRCHRGGSEGGTVGPDLTAVAPRDPVAFAAAMWNKAATMVEAMQAAGVTVPRFTGAEMADLVAYLGRMQYFAEAGSPARGRTTAETAGCTGCHGGAVPVLDAPGNRGAAIAALWNHVTVPPDALRTQWRRLTVGQVADLMAHLETRGRRP